MAEDALITLRENLPEVFEEIQLPPGWGEDWHWIDEHSLDELLGASEESLAAGQTIGTRAA